MSAREWLSNTFDPATEKVVPKSAVVIDPGDREQVVRLAQRLVAHDDDSVSLEAQLQAALREFANPTPPKPPEPSGLGAVVEDAEGVLWVRYAPDGDTAPWVAHAVSVEYADIDAVKVLSEGVQS